MTKIALATAGFQNMNYLGVGCVWCPASIKLEGLESTNAAELIKMHIKTSPKCTFVSIFDKQIRHPDWTVIEDRSQSFQNDEWQQNIDRPSNISNEKWAELGVFFCNEWGTPTCFVCGYQYHFTGNGWTAENVTRNHAYERPRCRHLIKIKGIAFIEEHMARPFAYRKNHMRKLINI